MPVEQAVLRERVDREASTLVPSGSVSVARLEIDAELGAAARAASACEQPRVRRRVDDDGQQPVLERVARGRCRRTTCAMTARKPQPTSAHGACSRDEPQPKLSPGEQDLRALRVGLFRAKSGFGEPSAS